MQPVPPRLGPDATSLARVFEPVRSSVPMLRQRVPFVPVPPVLGPQGNGALGALGRQPRLGPNA